jgi:small conductance mechanosensitive channel
MSPIMQLAGYLAPYLPVAVIAGATALVAWVAQGIVGRLLSRTSPRMAGVGRRLVAGVIALIGGTLALQALGVNPDVLLVVVGLLGAAIVVGLREPLGNYGAKYFTDVYTPFKVGDSIEVLGHAGKVIEINAMTTVLLAEHDRLVSVPNQAMIREVVVNTSPHAWKELTIPLSVGSNLDMPTFESDLRKSLSKLRSRLDTRFPPVVTTQTRSAQTTDLTLTLMVRRPEDRDPITLEVNQRVAEVLARARPVRR